MKCLWIAAAFVAMCLIAAVVGFATDPLISPAVMWMSVFTRMPIVSALRMYWYLVTMRIRRQSSLTEVFYLAISWIVLCFGLDAATCIFIPLAASRTAPNWIFFRDQSPWIWLSYAVLMVSAIISHKRQQSRIAGANAKPRSFTSSPPGIIIIVNGPAPITR
jgi:hypothetical protein